MTDVKFEDNDDDFNTARDDETDDTTIDDTAESSRPKRRNKRAAGLSSFKDFLKGLTKLSSVGKEVGEASTLLKNVKSGVRSFDDIVTKLPVTKNRRGALLIGDEFVGTVRRVVRQGDLDVLVKIAKQPSVVVSGAEKNAFKTLVADTPEKILKDLSDLTSKTKQLHASLDTTVENIGKLSSSSKAELKKVESNLMKRFKQGAIISLTIGAVYVGVDWISKTTEARKGCFMLTTINNKVSSCKVAAFSCAGGTATDTSNACQSLPPYYNVTLILMAIAQLDNTDQRKIDVAKAANVNVTDLKSNLAKVIDESYEKVSAVITSMSNKPNVNVCTISNPGIENGVIPPCRMCSTSDNPSATTFIDPNQFPENVTFQCVTNPSVLETITDAVTSTGANLWEGVGSSIVGPIKRFGVVLAIILILVLVIWFASRLFVKK